MSPPRPTILPPQLDAIPDRLKERRQWVCWKLTLAPTKDKWTKVPYIASTGHHPHDNRSTRSRKASTTDPQTWATFDAAVTTMRARGFDGLGFVFAEDDPFVGIDFDHCYQDDDGCIFPEIKDEIDALDSYTERSPSGTGVHVIGEAVIPRAGKKAHLEMYDQGRFFTITGHHIASTPPTIERRHDQITALHTRHFRQDELRPPDANGQRPKITLALSDQAIVGRMFAAANGEKVRRLYNGDTGGHPSQNEADSALCWHFSFWTRNPTQIDSLFRSSGLFRPEKWDARHYSDGATYGERTIERALALQTEFYTGVNGAAPQVGAHHAGSPPATPGTVNGAGDLSPETEHLSDLGNARRLIRHHGTALRYCHPWSKWLVWNGRCWEIDECGAVIQRAKTVVGTIYGEATAAPTEDARKALGKHALKSEGSQQIKAMVSLAQSEPGIPVLPDDLDQDPWLLNVENGTLDLRTGILHPHDPDALITKRAPVTYDADAEAPTWMKFLHRILDGDEDLIGFLQRAIGYTLTGRTTERAVFLLWGSGRNGKTTLIETLMHLLGDYAKNTPTDTLMVKRGESHIPNDVAALKGARFVSASETEEGRRLSASVVKKLTGGDSITARFMRGEFFTFAPQFKVWLATNHKPVIRGDDQAVWDRVHLVPFLVRIPDDEQDKGLKEKLIAEAPGILAWAVRGCLAWQSDDSLKAAQAVKVATSEYRSEMDTIGHFLEDCCLIDKQASVTSRGLYDAYKGWCDQSGERHMTQTAFGRIFTERGFESGKIAGIRSWKGLGLLDWTRSRVQNGHVFEGSENVSTAHDMPSKGEV